jgi:small multidrug resistance pump
MPYLLLAAAIALEVMATINLRLSDGFTRLVPSILVVLGYLGAFGLLSQVLKAGIPVGVAYGIWAAAGVALVAIIGAVFLGDGLTPVQISGIALVVAGVLALELGAGH